MAERLLSIERVLAKEANSLFAPFSGPTQAQERVFYTLSKNIFLLQPARAEILFTPSKKY